MLPVQGFPITPFLWGISGYLTSISTEGSITLQTYSGEFEVDYNNSGTLIQVYTGYFTLTDKVTVGKSVKLLSRVLF
jgi:hypothetical protein